MKINSNEMKEMFKEYLKEHLTIEKRVEGGLYGSKSYTVIELKLDNELISDVSIDD